MDMSTACRILGIESTASLEEFESARRKLLQALHPDKHPSEQREIFEKMTRDVIEASEFLAKAILSDRNSSRQNSKHIPEQILFDENAARPNTQGGTSQNGNLVKYERRYDHDKVLAIAVLSIFYNFYWQTKALLDREIQSHSGSHISLLVMNRTDKAVSGLFLGQDCYLVDNRGYQYSPVDTSFYWSGTSGEFNRHSDFVSPQSKVDGLILFPGLRKDSSRFTRLFYHGRFSVHRDVHEGNYDIKLS